ncbi:uncharacterized protein F54H12.2-like [Mercenaria mercenaria]|uniref:uncharacterized protein F54H12.2-like n=1 Tax=Mercenaria mercenaria TaxID=6596 RepID=UPI00234EFAAE|nr:uncharacterized protein F54H12.2-like [Mercenaria mercenaria]
MSVLSPLSDNETAPSSLDIFQVYPNQVAVQKSELEDIRPVSQYNGVDAPLEFETSLQGDTYCDMKSSKLFLKVRIVGADGSSLADTAKVTPCDMFFHAMFKKVDVYMNRNLISSTGDLYPYKAYFNKLFRHNSSKSGHTSAESELFLRQDGGLPGSTNPNGGNYGVFLRHNLGRGSRQFDMVGLPLNDILELDRYLINGIHLRLVLHRSSSEFCLLSDEDDNGRGYTVQIHDAYLRLCKMKLNPAILLAHSKMLKTVTACYPFIRTETKCANIARGQSTFSWDHINSSYLPKFVIVAFVESESVLGSLKKNPFNMEHFDVRQLSLLVNGVACAGNPINVNYGEGQVMEVFNRIYGYDRGIPNVNALGGISGKDRGHVGISREAISKGKAVYVFDLAPVINEDFHFELLNTGTLSLHVKFGSSLAQNVTCILYAEFDSLLLIDEPRSCKVV